MDNKERSDLAKTARTAQLEGYAKQSIQIDKRHRLYRLDDYNWTIEKDNDPRTRWFYHNLLQALNAIPDKLLNEGDKSDIKSIQRQVEEIKRTIDQVLNMVGKL